MKHDRVDKEIQALDESLEVLRLEAEARDADQSALLGEALEEVSTALEELRVSADELRQRNIELATAQGSIDAERQRYQDLFEQAPDAYVVTDARGNVVEANRAAAALFGRRAQYLASRPLVSFVAEDAREVFRARLERLPRAGARPQSWDVPLRQRDGAVVDTALTVAAVCDPEGRVAGFRWLLRDITERSREKQRLATQHRVTAVLAESATPDDLMPKLLQALCETTGWELAEAWRVDGDGAVLHWDGVWHAPAVDAAEFVAVSRAMTFPSGEGLPGRVCANGRSEWMADVAADRAFLRAALAAKLGLHTAFAFPMRSSGAVIGIVVLFSHDRREPDPELLKVMDDLGSHVGDFVARKRAEAALREAEELGQKRERLAELGVIAAQIVHDVGNPLAALAMQAQLILHRIRSAENQPASAIFDGVERILATVRRLDALTRGFKGFVHEQRLELEDIDLPQFLRDLIAFWQPEADERGITLALELGDALPSVQADAMQLRRVLDNLVKNALEAVREGPGLIRIVTALPVPEKVRISVEDSGPGIPEDVNVFGLFQTTKPEGTGLGLAIAKQIMLAHGGGIEFASRQPHGTVFHIELSCRGPAL